MCVYTQYIFIASPWLTSRIDTTLEVPMEEKDCIVIDANMSVEEVKHAAALATGPLILNV